MNPTPSNDLTRRLLEAGPDAIANVLEDIDGTEPANVAAILTAAASIAREHILPAAPSLIRSDDGSSHFDLDVVAGYEIPGLIGGILKMRFPNLAGSPPDDILEQELEAAGFDIDDPVRRQRFFEAWMARRASYAVGRLVESVDPAAVASQPELVDLVETLARQDLDGSTRRVAVRLLSEATPERAQALQHSSAEPFLREAVDEFLPETEGDPSH